MAIIRKEFKKFGMCVEKLEPSYIADGKVKWYSHFDEQLAVPQRLDIKLPDLAITLLGTYPRNMKTYVQTKTCTKMLMKALLIIAQC